MSKNVQKPVGTVGLPALLCAVAGSVVSVGLDLMGHFDAPETAISAYWEKDPFFLSNAVTAPNAVYWLAAFFVCWLVSVLTLASAFAWRRILVGLMFLSVLLAFSPVLMLWGILWQPLVVGVAVVWAWFCALLYGSQHTMPSELEQEVCEEQPVSNTTEKVKMKVETVPFPCKKKFK